MEEQPPGQLWPGQHEGAGDLSGDALDPGTGSLTGHILRQGRPDTDPGTGHGRRTVVLVLAVIGVLVIVALVGAVLRLSGMI